MRTRTCRAGRSLRLGSRGFEGGVDGVHEVARALKGLKEGVKVVGTMRYKEKMNGSSPAW